MCLKLLIILVFVMPTVGVAAEPAGPVVEASPSQEAPLPLYTTKMGAYSDPDDPAKKGVFLELILELGRIAKIPMVVSDLPWSRALHVASLDKEPGLVFPLIRTPQREHDFSWVIDALNDNQVFFGRADSKDISSMEDLQNYHIGVIRGSPFERQLTTLAFKNLDIAPDAVANAKKLRLGRIDYWYVTYNTATHTFALLGFPLSGFKVAYTASRTEVFIGANKSFPADKAAALRAAFQEVKKSGWYAQLLKKYDVVDAGEPPGATSKK